MEIHRQRKKAEDGGKSNTGNTFGAAAAPPER